MSKRNQLPSLSKIDQLRLERLATAAKSTPKKMLKFVLRDGFDYCAYVVHESNAGIASLERGDRKYVTTEVMRQINRLIEKHDRRAKQAA